MSIKRLLLQSTVLVAAAALSAGANAQMVVNLTNIDPTLYTTFDPNGPYNTDLNVTNLGSASTTGGLGAGAASLLNQQGTNQINSIGFTAMGAASPVVFGNALPVTGPSTVEINTITAAGYQVNGWYGESYSNGQAKTSLTVTNSNWSVANGFNVIPNTPGLNTGTQTYGAAPASTLVGGSQIGVNQANAVGAAFADGTVVSLNQLPGVAVVPDNNNSSGPLAGTAYTAQPGYDNYNSGAQINMSVLNNMVAYSTNGSAQVNGQTAGPNGTTLPGNQAAINTFNTAAIYGNVNLNVGQEANAFGYGGDGAATIQGVNQAIAYNAQMGNSQLAGKVQSAGDVAGVSNLNQISQMTVNQLALGSTSNATGSMTLSGHQSGDLQPMIQTNQMVANSGAGDTGIMQAHYSAWDGWTNGATFPGGAGFPGLPVPGSENRVSADPIGAATLSNVGQSIGISLNTVNAGNVNINTGLAGFSQHIGSMLLSGGTDGNYGQPLASEDGNALNAAGAFVVQGRAAISNLTQGMTVQGNVLTSQGNISGGVNQSVQYLNFSAAGLAPSTEYGSGGSLGTFGYGTPHSGPVYGAGPYTATTGEPAGLAANAATAYGAYNTNTSLANVAQNVSAFANVLSTSGTIDPGAGASVVQTGPNISNWGSDSVGSSLNQQYAGSYGNGNASISGLSQKAALTSNLIAGGAGINGQVVQNSATLNNNSYTGGSNVAVAGNLPAVWGYGSTLGNASISGVAFDGTAATLSQSNVRSFNSIATGGSLGSSASPAAIQQLAAPLNFDSGDHGYGFSTPGTGNGVLAITYSAPGQAGNGNATVNNISQSSSLSVNNMAAGAGMYGNALQSSTGMVSTLGNTQYAVAGCTNGCGATYTVGTGNATLTNATQLTNQSLNTASLVGSVNSGNINQQAAGTTALNTVNQLQSAAGYGYALTTGAQVGSNAVNVITAAAR